MNHGIHYVSNCWTFVFVSRCILPGRCTAEVNAQMHDHCQSTCRLFIQCFFSIFSLDATLQCTLLAVILSRFGHRPSYYTAIDFWSNLEHPSDLELVTTHAIIPQLIPGICTHAIILQLIPGIWSGLAHPSGAKSCVISQISLLQ